MLGIAPWCSPFLYRSIFLKYTFFLHCSRHRNTVMLDGYIVNIILEAEALEKSVPIAVTVSLNNIHVIEMTQVECYLMCFVKTMCL